MTQVDIFFENVREYLTQVDCTVEPYDYPGGKVYVVEVGGVPTYRVNVPGAEDERIAASLRCSFVQVRFMSAEGSFRDLLIKTLFQGELRTSKDLKDGRFKIADPEMFLSRVPLSVQAFNDGEVDLTGVCPDTFGLTEFEEALISGYWDVICEKLLKYFPLPPSAGVNFVDGNAFRVLVARYPNVLKLLSHVFPDVVEKYQDLNFKYTGTRSILSGRVIGGLGNVISREIEIMDYLSAQWDLLKVTHLDPECAAQVRLLNEGRILNSSFQNFVSARGHDPDILDRLDDAAPSCLDSLGVPKMLPTSPQVDALMLHDGVPFFARSTFKPSGNSGEYKQSEDLSPLYSNNGWTSKSIPHACRTMMASKRTFEGREEVLMRAYRELLAEVASMVANEVRSFDTSRR